jgi:endonuclease YncB( thermonuclease family)
VVKFRGAVLTLAAVLCAQQSIALEDGPYRISGPVLADVMKVTDGDTLEVRAYPWPNTVMELKVRMNGIEAPERSCRGPHNAAKDAASQFVSGKRVVLTNIQDDKYGGRVLADVSLNGAPLATSLIRKHPKLFRVYSRGRDFCPV